MSAIASRADSQVVKKIVYGLTIRENRWTNCAM